MAISALVEPLAAGPQACGVLEPESAGCRLDGITMDVLIEVEGGADHDCHRVIDLAVQ